MKTRMERAVDLNLLLLRGHSRKDAARILGISYGHAWAVLDDPTGAKTRARKDRYRGECIACGKPTDGSNGPAKAPALCIACTRTEQGVPHGAAGYVDRGCRCDICRDTWNARIRDYNHRKAVEAGARCVDCGAQLKVPDAKRCRPCHGRCTVAAHRKAAAS